MSESPPFSLPNSKKRTLPYELRSEIMQYTNKRICRELGYEFEYSKIEHEFNRDDELYLWNKVSNPILKLEFMNGASTLVSKNLHKRKRSQLKNDIQLVKSFTDKNDQLYYNKIYVKCMNTSTGCDVCNTFGSITRCTECNMECHNNCCDFLECNGCNKQHCKFCIKKCIECNGYYCNSLIKVNYTTYEYICISCIVHCDSCYRYYRQCDSSKCSDCNIDVCGCRTCKICLNIVCNSTRQCIVCELDTCKKC
jgi:hypothetical protein